MHTEDMNADNMTAGNFNVRDAETDDPCTDLRYATREAKAQKIVEILTDALDRDLAECRALDVGCSTGAISNRLAPHVAALTGLDFDGPAVETATKFAAANARYLVADGSTLPFAAAEFDLVVCAQVYEHAPRQALLVQEIRRVLRPGGICFFSGPNRLAIVEEHYWLPFLSWLPQGGADAYMHLFNRGPVYDAMPRTYWTLRRLLAEFEIHDYTVDMLVNPARYGVRDKLGVLGWIGRLPRPLLESAMPFLPNFNWILVKPA